MIEKLDEVIAGLQELRNGFAQHADLAAKIEKEKNELLAARSLAGGLSATIKRKTDELHEIEKKIATANTELKEIKAQIADRNSYKQTIQSEINGLRERLGL